MIVVTSRKAIATTALAAALGGLMLPARAPAAGPTSSVSLVPLGIGNQWNLKRYRGGVWDQVELRIDREEAVGGSATSVLQGRAGGKLFEEWFLSTSAGLKLHRLNLYDYDVAGTPADVKLDFSPAVQLTDPLFDKDAVKITFGDVAAQFGTSPPLTIPYFASTKVLETEGFAFTPGAITVGTRTHTTLHLSGPAPIGGFAFAEFFWGRDLGPVWMSLDGLGFSEQKRLLSTNVDREATSLVSAHSPTVRASWPGREVTAFAAMINSGNTLATGCGLAPHWDLNLAPFTFSYAETDPLTNAVIGGLNPLVDIPPGGVKTFVFGLVPKLGLDFRRLAFVHDCAETPPARGFVGLNDFGFSVSLNPSPDILLIGRTINANNIVDLEGPTGASAFAVAGSNLGATGPVTVSGAPLDPSTPVKVTVCETHSHTGACLHPPAFEVGLDWSGGTNRTFAFFIEGLGMVPDDLATQRVEARAFWSGVQVGGWNAALRSKPAP